MNQESNICKELESQPFFEWVDDKELRSQLSQRLIIAIKRRKECFTQKDVSKYIDCSLTKVKEIESGKTEDFNSINNYFNLMQV